MHDLLTHHPPARRTRRGGRRRPARRARHRVPTTPSVTCSTTSAGWRWRSPRPRARSTARTPRCRRLGSRAHLPADWRTRIPADLEDPRRCVARPRCVGGHDRHRRQRDARGCRRRRCPRRGRHPRVGPGAARSVNRSRSTPTPSPVAWSSSGRCPSRACRGSRCSAPSSSHAEDASPTGRLIALTGRDPDWRPQQR